MNINKSPRRIKRDAGGRNKNPMAQLVKSPLYKPKVKPSGKLILDLQGRNSYLTYLLIVITIGIL